MVSVPVAGYNANLYIASGPVSMTNEAVTNSGDNQTFTVTNSAKRGISTADAVTVQAEWDEIQTVTITGSPTGGNFTLTLGSNTTGNIAPNASAATVQAALITALGAGTVSVTGANGGPWTIEFIGSLGYAAQSLLTANSSGLTGGSSPLAVPARVQAGQGYTTQSASLYSISYAIGQVFFAAALLGTPVCRISGKYLPFTFVGFAYAEQFNAQGKMIDVTHQTNPVSSWESYIPGPNSATIKISTYWIDGTYLNHLNSNDLLIIQFFPNAAGTAHLQGYGVLTGDSIKSAKDAANTEGLDFKVNGPLYYAAA